MDSLPPAPNFSSSRPTPANNLSRTASSSQAQDGSRNREGIGLGHGANGSLRRGHSDGDILGSQLGGSRSTGPTDEETWMDFLRDSPRQGDGADAQTRARFAQVSAQTQARMQERQLARHRAALMVADRRRRLAEQQENHARRRSESSSQIEPARTAVRTSSTSTPSLERSLNSTTNPPRLAESAVFDRPLPRRSDASGSRRRASREIVLPRWQPDSEVMSCPICGTRFGWWIRKHHCRKCGRVVCANCSPHRITIPRQFIVQPPQDTAQEASGAAAGVEIVDLTGDPDTRAHTPRGSEGFDSPQSPVLRIDPALGGGQEVRLCNPCVPDPNPLPHLPFEAPSRLGFHPFPRPDFEDITERSSSSSHRPFEGVPQRSSSIRHNFHPSSGRSFDAGNANPQQGSVAGSSNQQPPRPPVHPRHFHRVPMNDPTAYGSVPDRSLHDRYLDSILPPSHHRHRHHSSTSTVPDSRYRSLSDLNAPLPPRPLPPRPQPQLREEDECPICHQALPPKGPDGGETARERHITECIEEHFSTSTPRANRPHPVVATSAAVSASAAGTSQSQAAGGSSSSYGNERRGSESAGNGNAFQRMGSQRRRVAGMVTYAATEKDCIGEGGEAAECVICFEDFEQGVEMGRLECLCKFHKACIRQWWDTKGVGACPVHQGGLT